MKTLLFAVLLTGLVSCTENTILTVQKVTDGQVLQIESSVSLNKAGDSIVICETYSSGYGTRYGYYGNLAADMPEDYINLDDSISIFSRSYHVAVVKKVE